MFTTDRKISQRNSILKNSKKQETSSNCKHQSTGLGVSLKFRQPKEIEEEVKEFTEEEIAKKEEVHLQAPYERWNLMKDVNYLNSVYNHILVMISSHINKPEAPKNYQIVKMSNQIERTILENIQLKSEIDLKYKSMMNLQELAEHLNATPQELGRHHLSSFLSDFQEKEQKALELSKQLENMQKASFSQSPSISNDRIRQKQQKCKTYRKIIQKQRLKIIKLEQEQRSLLKKLYETQKQIVKNQHSSSTIKLKLAEAQDNQQKRIRSKTREAKPPGKQNLPSSNKQKKCMKIQQLQKLRCFSRRLL